MTTFSPRMRATEMITNGHRKIPGASMECGDLSPLWSRSERRHLFVRSAH